ncbi:MAG TPA: glycoside hydrolase family 16 protein [Friedmanniella sp.]
MSKRRSRLPLLGTLSAVAVAVLLVVGLRVGTHKPSAAETMFVDNFDGPAGQAPDPGRWGEWSTCTYNDSASYGDIKCGSRSSLDGQGHLLVRATPGTGTSISTGGHFSFVYGEASAWIKMPSAVGYWPAFWTLNSDPSGKTQNPNGEIDVLETYTTFPTVYHRGTHNWNAGDLAWGSPGDPRCGNVDLSAAFHKYSVRVEPRRVTFFFDDVQCGDVVTKADGQGKPYQLGPDNPAGSWLLLSLAIGGADGQQKPPTEPAAMVVDSVEVKGL